MYWVLRTGSDERVLAVDRFSYAYEAGRISGDQSVNLQCRLIMADGVKTIDVPIKVKETMQDPEFTLRAPERWDGRSPIEVGAQITSGGASALTDWSVGPFAVIKEVAAGKLLLKRAQASGPLTVTATMSNGGARISRSVTIDVKEPVTDAWGRARCTTMAFCKHLRRVCF